MAARLIVTVAMVVLGTAIACVNSAMAQADNDHTVLILSATVTGGAASAEASAAAALGYDVEFVDETEWAAMDADDFATYRAIILGDPTCYFSYSDTEPIDPAVNNADVWGPIVDGNVVIIASDPVFHITHGPSAGASALVSNAIEFVLSVPITAGRTGAYICLSCYWNFSTMSIPLLSYIGNGGFSMTEADCWNDVHITAFHPALEDLTDDDLSNWYCSIHNVFTDWDEENFQVLAIGDGYGSTYTDEDGHTGSPYILAKGVCSVLPTITVSVSPSTLWPPNNRMNEITATVVTTGEGVTVELVSITSDESGVDEDVEGASFGTDDRVFSVRAQRDGGGDGRVYTVTYRVTDECYHTAEATATVSIPHDQGE